MEAMHGLIAACAAFVGTHLLLSHPLRAPLVRMLGAGGFAIAYSLVALATFGWIIWAWVAMPLSPPHFVPGDGAWAAASVAMWLATLLLVGSFSRNPAMPAPGAAEAAMRTPTGVFAITRHPMMWSFALWALVHILIWPTPENHILATAILLLAIIGSAGQDRKKAAQMGDAWRGWQSRTAFVPFAGQIAGRTPWGAIWPGFGQILLATALWAAITWAHMPAGARVAAGVWRWL